MNVTVYLFGKLGAGYTQYPDDYARDIFSTFEYNIQSPSQMMIHRKDALIYYGYMRKLSEQGKYIGISFVFNGVMCSDIPALCKLCEDNITNWVVSGEILEFADNGDIVSKVDKLYKTVSEFKRLSESLSAQIVSAKLPFLKLPPVNYAVSANAVKTFNIDDQNEAFIEALKEYSNIYIYSDSTSATLAGYSDKLRRLSKENSDLKAENAKVLREKKRTTIVTILVIILAVGFIAILSLVDSSNQKTRQINSLERDKTNLTQHVDALQRDSVWLENQWSSTKYELSVQQRRANRLQSDSTRLSKENKELKADLATANKNIAAYRQTIEQKDRQIADKDRTISELRKSSSQSSSYQSAPFSVSSVSVSSTRKGGSTASDFGYTLYSSSSYGIKVKMTYRATSSGSRNITIKLYGPSSYTSGYAWYDSEVESVYLYSAGSSSYTYTFSKVLDKNGNKLSAGSYYVEICYDSKVVKTQYFTIK